MLTASESRQDPDPVLTLLRQFFEVSATVNADVRDVLAEFDLTDSMSTLLWMLDPERPPLRMRELARGLSCDPSNVTLIGDKLEQAGLVTRQSHPDDRRARVLALTDRGRDIRRTLLPRLVAATPLPHLTVREQHQLGQLLVKLGARAEPGSTASL